MAEWIPSMITNEHGIYSNRVIPIGSLNKFAEYAYSIGGGNIQTDVSLNSVDNFDEYKWAGAFGLEGAPILSYFGNHEGEGVITDVKMLEITVKNPEGAQFYRQSLAVYLRGSCNETEYSNPDYIRTITEYTIDHISRLQYDTPTSIPIETDLTGRCTASTVFIEYLGDVPQVGKIGDKMRCGFSPCYYDDELYYGVYFFSEFHYDDSEKLENEYNMVAIPVSTLNEEFGGTFDPEETDDPNEDVDPDGPGDDGPGGGGEKDKTQDPIPEPALPPLSGVAAGFITMYKLYETSMQTFAKKLFDPDIWGAVKSIFADPMDFICGILILPFSPHTSRSARPILQQVPPIAWDYYYPVVEDQYHIVDCGYIDVPLFYKNAFDFNPYTKDKLYLPYCGYVELNPDEIQGKRLSVKYHIDCLTGDCVAIVMRSTVSHLTPVTQVIAQHSGNCGTRVAYGRQSFDNAIAAGVQMMSSAAGIIGGVSLVAGGSGALQGGGKQLAEGMIAGGIEGMGMSAVNGSKAHTERGGVMGASVGLMGIQYPYLIREIPNQSLPDGGAYRRLNGYPCNESGVLNDFNGYTCIESIELKGIGATEDEKTEILNMLTAGVIV